jgi:protein arginine kinase activator
MLCSICKEKDATVHLTQIDGDKMRKVDLCEDCAKTKGASDSTGYYLAELLHGLAAPATPEPPAAGSDVKCPRCGFTQADFKKAGRLGCPECYKTFAEPLEGLLKTMHKGTRHVGKVPESMRQNRDLTDRLKYLQKKLSKAIENEDFEEAAQVRDEIKQTTARMANPAAAA